VVVYVLRAVVRTRLVTTKYPSAYATVCCKRCKSAIALYLSVIKCECVTKC
jgi:hypothetical protein